MTAAPDPVAARFVADLLSYMTIEEKLGQLDLFHSPDDPALEQAIAAGRVGGVAGIAHAARWQGLATERSRLGIPLLLTAAAQPRADSPWALAASWDAELARAAGALAADRAIEAGGNACDGPRVSLAIPDRLEGAGGAAAWGEGADFATSEPYLAAVLAEAFCEGAAASERGPRAAALMPVRCDGGSSSAAQAFARALAGEGIVPAIASAAFDHAEADRCGYHGIVLEDCARIRAAVARQYATTRALSPAEAAESAIGAGLLSDGAIDAAVRGVLLAKFRLALFRDPQRLLGPGSAGAGPEASAERRRREMVLLRNESGLLPLSPVSDRVLVAGSGEAASACIRALGRAGIGHSAAPGLAARHPGESAVQQSPGDPFAIALTRDAATRADFVLVVLEDGHFIAGEPGAWGRPGPAAMALLKALASTGTRLVGIVASAKPVDLGDADQHFAAVLQSWAPAEGFEEALADVLSGRAGPQGRMPVAAGRFAFGQGMGYGEGVFTALALEPGASRIDGSVTVRNAGSFAGRETVQVYVGTTSGGLRLAAFSHVMLAAGEEAIVRFELGLQALGEQGANGRMEIAPGPREIFVGKDMRRLLARTVEISPALARAIVNRERSLLRLAG